jgi:hypothetical protein
MLFTRERFENAEMASAFFIKYAEALRKKYPARMGVTEEKQNLELTTADGDVFFRCEAKECVTLEGGDGKMFAQWMKKIGWVVVTTP